jgi:uncharacterized coiled-coil DUF342 family protein
MDDSLWVAILAAVSGLASVWISWRKTKSETVKTGAEAEKIKAETESIHAQVADRWAEHVQELQDEVKGLRMDVAQIRRENERYRAENADLRDWARRLVGQLAEVAPDVTPEKYICRHVYE